MEVTYYSHASIQITSTLGVKILTDPWIFNPIYGNMLWQFPENKIGLTEYLKQDILFISHTHPDHYSAETLRLFDRNIPIIIQKYTDGTRMKEELNALGFMNIIELGKKETYRHDDDLRITLVNDGFIDSVIVVSDGDKSIFNQNDCFLSDEDLSWIGDNFSIDVACLFFMGVGIFPGSFDMTWEQKVREIDKKRTAAFERCLKTAKLIGAKKIIPFSSDMTWLRKLDLARLNGALPVEFRDYCREKDTDLEILLLSSGEKYSFVEDKSCYTNYFKTKEEMIKAITELRNHPSNVELIQKLEQYENSFVLDEKRFVRLFNEYCAQEYQKSVPTYSYKKPKEKFKVGWRITHQDGPTSEYAIEFSPGHFGITQAGTELDAIKSTLHMIIHVESHLLEMVVAQALTVEDLNNCRYFIWRPGSYTADEDSFWLFLSAFSVFLADTQQKDLRVPPPEKGIVTSFLNASK